MPGPFYVEDGSCVICEAPYHEAPDVMAHDEAGGGHCYFRRQPETPQEVERAISACCVSCVSAVRYSGNAPEILRRFRELGQIDACDVLAAEWYTPVIQDKSWESLTLKEKLEIARHAVHAKRESANTAISAVKLKDKLNLQVAPRSTQGPRFRPERNLRRRIGLGPEFKAGKLDSFGIE